MPSLAGSFRSFLRGVPLLIIFVCDKSKQYDLLCEVIMNDQNIGDTIRELLGTAVRNAADISLALCDAHAGERVQVRYFWQPNCDSSFMDLLGYHKHVMEENLFEGSALSANSKKKVLFKWVHVLFVTEASH